MTPNGDDVGTGRALLRSPNRSRSTVAVATGAAVAGICWYFGLEAWWAATFGAVGGTGALGLLYGAWPDRREAQWHDIQPATTGARHDIFWLASSLRPRYGRVGDAAVRALRDLARSRLALCHLDLTEPDQKGEIERLIGRHVYAVLRPERRWKPTYRTVLHCLDVLDGLDGLEERHER